MNNHDNRIQPREQPRGDEQPSGGALASIAMAGYWLPALAFYSDALRKGLTVHTRTTSARGFGLTFDDGPHACGTPAVLEILARSGAKATFFLVGEQAERHPDLVREIARAGHDIGIHCQRHRNLLRLAPWQVREDLSRAAGVIEDLTRRPLSLYRPPYGILNAAALRIARERGWRTFLWSNWGKDWRTDATAASIASLLTRDASPGAVGLLHDADHYSTPGSWEHTVAALPLAIRELDRQGLELTSL